MNYPQRLLLLLAFCCLNAAVPNAQPGPAERKIWLEKGHELYARQQYDKARQFYDKVIDSDTAHFDGHFFKALCFYAEQNYPEARPLLEKCFRLDPKGDPALAFYLGETYFFGMFYEEAAVVYKGFLEVGHPNKYMNKTARRRLENARWSAEAIKHPVTFEPKNMGPAINGSYEDYNAALTADDSVFVFNSHRPGNIGGYNDAIWMDYASDLFWCEKGPGGWQPAVRFEAPLNTRLHEKEFCLTPDGQYLYFGRHPLSNYGNYNCELHVSRKTAAGWSDPQPLPNVNASDACDSWPSLSADGETLYFVSNRTGGYGGYDVWFSRRGPDGEWSAPENLGPNVNTGGDEFDVFAHPDGVTLYFSSNGWPGFGGYDIYKTELQPDGKLSRPENLGFPLNTAFDEMDFFVDAAGTTGFMNSDRKGGFGMADIYSFVLDPKIRPKGAASVKGRVTDCASLKPVLAGLVFIDGETGDTIRALPAGADGVFLAALPAARAYTAYATAPGYLFDSRNFELREPGGKLLDLSLCLKKIEADSAILLDRVYFDFDSHELRPDSEPELRQTLAFLNEYPDLVVELGGHTDGKGDEAYNEALSLKRAEAVKSWLVEKGAEAERIEIRAYGERMPSRTERAAEDRAGNRRTEIRLTVRER